MLKFIRKYKPQVVLQQDQTDCGAACLSSIIKYYGGIIEIDKIRQVSGTSQYGTTLLGLRNAAIHFGFEAEGFEVDSIENLKGIQQLAILHVNISEGQHHFIIFFKWLEDNRILVGDPAKGLIKLTVEQLTKMWESKALLALTTTSNFINQSSILNKKRDWFINLIRIDLNKLILALFLGIIISVLNLSTAIFSEKLIDEILPSSNEQKLFIALALVTLLLIFRALLSYLRGFVILQQSKDFNIRIVEKFFQRLIRLTKSFFDTRKTGDIIARLNDTRRIQAAVNALTSSIIIDFIIVVVSVAFVYYYSTVLGIIVVFSLPIYFTLVYSFNGRIVESQKELMKSYAVTESNFIDSIQGISTIKSQNKEEYFDLKNKFTYGQFQNKIFNLGKLNIKFGVLADFIGIAFTLAVFGTCSWMVLIGKLQLGGMVAILTMASGILPALGRLVTSNIQIQEANVAFSRMFELANMKTENESIDSFSQTKTNLNGFETLQLTNIAFGFYPSKQILSNVSLSVHNRKITCIFGESGAGKSTIIQLLQKFYLPQSGTIKIDDNDIRSIHSANWRNLIGVVPQEIKIFNGNLLYNITLSEQESDSDLAKEICSRYGFNKYFEHLPQGYLTLLGEEGINLSGGQKQLVAFARALYCEPKLLLLDEATSSMDKITEGFIMDLLLNLKNDAGILFITHKPSIASKSDIIYVLENGIISAKGTPTELLESDNFYSRAFSEEYSY